MKNIKKLLFLPPILLLFGCNAWPIIQGTFATTWTYKPDGFVELVIFQGDIIDITREGISSKEELIAFVDSAQPDISHRLFVWIYFDDLTWRHLRENIMLVAYINTYQDGNAILSKNNLPKMPIILRPGGRGWAGGLPSWGERSFRNRTFSSENYVVLVKGDPAFWANSAFEYGDRTFVILPISDGTPNAEIRFTYSITKTTIEDLERKGYL